MPGAPDILLDDFGWRDGWPLYKIASHPDFYYRPLNDRNAWIAWRAVRYVTKAKISKYYSGMGRVVKAIRLQPTGEFIGCVLLTDLNKEAIGQTDLGWYVAVPQQGKNIGTAAALRFVDWCLDRYGIQIIETRAHPENTPSLKIMARLGLKPSTLIPAEESQYFGRDGQREPRMVTRGNRAEIEEALRVAREQGLYTRSIPVL